MKSYLTELCEQLCRNTTPRLSVVSEATESMGESSNQLYARLIRVLKDYDALHREYIASRNRLLRIVAAVMDEAGKEGGE